MECSFIITCLAPANISFAIKNNYINGFYQPDFVDKKLLSNNKKFNAYK
jgi:hypothetical protein